MNEIEAEIRRQMLEERDRALQSQVPAPSGAAPGVPPSPNTGPYEPSPPPPNSSSYHALTPPSFPQAGPSYPPHYPSASYPPPSYPAQPTAPRALPSPESPAAPKSARGKGVLGGLGAIGIALAKFGGALKGLLIGFKFLWIGKYLITAGSMLVSIALYSALFGWRFAVGIVLLIFVHEMGHALALKRLGHPVVAMVFVPLMGAFVQHRGLRNAAEHAQVAIMGPVAGMLAGLACGAVYGMTGSPLWLVLAYFSFYINLFNLSALSFLDGGRIAALIPPKLLLGGLLITALINFKFPLCWLLLVFALPLISERWRSGTIDPALQVSKRDQDTYTLAYCGMTLFLGFASLTTQQWLWDLRHLTRRF